MLIIDGACKMVLTEYAVVILTVFVRENVTEYEYNKCSSNCGT